LVAIALRLDPINSKMLANCVRVDHARPPLFEIRGHFRLITNHFWSARKFEEGIHRIYRIVMSDTPELGNRTTRSTRAAMRETALNEAGDSGGYSLREQSKRPSRYRDADFEAEADSDEEKRKRSPNKTPSKRYSAGL
jgi:hypothetical protein